jgi:hypothetical protein
MVLSKQKISKALTCDKLADIYDAQHQGRRPARTLPMEDVFEWAEKQTDRFYVHPKNGTLHRILEEK